MKYINRNSGRTSAKLVVGIDKIGVSTRDFSLNDASGWTVKSSSIIGGEEPEKLIQVGVSEIRGQKMHRNMDLANYDISDRGLKVVFNPSKINDPLVLIKDQKLLKETIEAVSLECSNIGLGLNLYDCGLFRLDPAKDMEMERSLKSYAPVFRLMEGTRMTGVEYEHGYEFRGGKKGKQWREQFYNKLLEHSIKNGLPLPTTFDSKLLRCELRALKKDAVNRYFKVKKLGDLVSVCDPGYLTYHYNEFQRKRIFKRDSIRLVNSIGDYDRIIDKLIRIRQNEKRSRFNKFVLSLTDVAIPFVSSDNDLKRLLNDAGYSQSAMKNFINQYRDFIRIQKEYNPTDNHIVTMKEMYQELEHKFAS